MMKRNNRMELKNRVAAALFGKYDCSRIVGNIDFCVLLKRRDRRQMTFIPGKEQMNATSSDEKYNSLLATSAPRTRHLPPKLRRRSINTAF
jgi:hypothetical protein